MYGKNRIGTGSRTWQMAAALIGLLALAACGGGGGASGGTGGEGGGGSGGGDPVTNLEVQILQPNGDVTIDGPLAVAVRVTGGQADEVQLLLGDMRIAVLDATLTHTWDPKDLLDGTYPLIARAQRDGVSFDSAPRQITVERKPTVAIEAPSQGARIPGTTRTLPVQVLVSGSAVESVWLQVDDKEPIELEPPYLHELSILSMNEGGHSLQAIVRSGDVDLRSEKVDFTIVAPEPIEVAWVTPVEGALVASLLSAEVGVDADVDSIELQLTGPAAALLHTFQGADRSAAVDVASVPEGQHELVAVAKIGRYEFSSSPRTIVIDRDRPKVVGQSPRLEEYGHPARRPVTIDFSKPIDRSSLTDDAVVITQEGRTLQRDLSLSDDGKRMTIQYKGRVDVAARISVALNVSIRDVAGLSLLPHTWSYDNILFQRMGSPADPEESCNFTDFGIGDDALPVAAFAIPSRLPFSTASDLYVKKWSDGVWSDLGTDGSMNQNEDWGIVGLTLAAQADGGVILAWRENSGFTWRNYLQYWDGTSWEDVPGYNLNDIFVRHIALVGDGSFYTVGDSFRAVEVRKFDAAGVTRTFFHEYGTDVSILDLKVNMDGDVLVRLQSQGVVKVHLWSDGEVQHLLDMDDPDRNALRFGPDGGVYRAWLEPQGLTLDVRVAKWATSFWQTVAPDFSIQGQGDPGGLSLTIDPAGKPFVAWVDREAERLQVRRFIGPDWQTLPSTSLLGKAPWNTALYPMPTGEPLVTWWSRFSNACHDSALYNGLY